MAPSPEEEDRRRLCRERRTLIEERVTRDARERRRDAVAVHGAEEAVAYIDKFDYSEPLPDDVANLRNLLYSLITVSLAVELWRQPRVKHSANTILTFIVAILALILTDAGPADLAEVQTAAEEYLRGVDLARRGEHAQAVAGPDREADQWD